MIITLYRRDFKDYVDFNGNFFDDVLYSLKIPKERKQEDIEEVEIKVESFEIIND